MIKHTVTTDALLTLGTVLSEGEAERDAIHIAVISVIAHETLRRGQRVAISNGKAFAAPADEAIGIIDPFLRDVVRYRDRCWVLLNPRTITSLRHVWSHPELPDESPVVSAPPATELDAARLAIRAVAADLGVSDEQMMEGAAKWLESGGDYAGYMCFGEDLSYSWDMDAFWDAYALLTGKSVPRDKRQSFFSCAC